MAVMLSMSIIEDDDDDDDNGHRDICADDDVWDEKTRNKQTNFSSSSKFCITVQIPQLQVRAFVRRLG